MEFTTTDESLAPQTESDPVSIKTIYIITLIIGVIGVLGNGLVLLVIFRQRKIAKSRLQNIFLINQTCMDWVSSAFMVITFSYKLTPRSLVMTGFGGFLRCVCLEGDGLMWIFVSASAFSLMTLTFDRYMKVVFPISHRMFFTSAWKTVLISFTWVGPFAWLFAFEIISTKVIDGVCLFHIQWPSEILANFYGWTYVIFYYFIPLVMFIYCYGHMLWTLHKRKSHVSDLASNQIKGTVSRAQINIIKTMLVVSMCFAVLWAPAQLYYFFAHIRVYTGTYLSAAYYAFNIICFINSAVNPFIYAAKLSEFRNVVMSMFLCKTWKPLVGQDSSQAQSSRENDSQVDN